MVWINFFAESLQIYAFIPRLSDYAPKSHIAYHDCSNLVIVYMDGKLS